MGELETAARRLRHASRHSWQQAPSQPSLPHSDIGAASGATLMIVANVDGGSKNATSVSRIIPSGGSVSFGMSPLFIIFSTVAPPKQSGQRIVGEGQSSLRQRPKWPEHRRQKIRVHPGQVCPLVRTEEAHLLHLGGFPPPTGRASALALFFDFLPMLGEESERVAGTSSTGSTGRMLYDRTGILSLY